MLYKKFGMVYLIVYFSNNYACLHLDLSTINYNICYNEPYFYWSIFKPKLSIVKSLVHRNFVELPVEIKLGNCMFNLSNLNFMLYAQINSGKITVLRISCIDVVVKLWAPESMHIILYKMMLFLAYSELRIFHD